MAAGVPAPHNLRGGQTPHMLWPILIVPPVSRTECVEVGNKGCSIFGRHNHDVVHVLLPCGRTRQTLRSGMQIDDSTDEARIGMSRCEWGTMNTQVRLLTIDGSSPDSTACARAKRLLPTKQQSRELKRCSCGGGGQCRSPARSRLHSVGNPQIAINASSTS